MSNPDPPVDLAGASPAPRGLRRWGGIAARASQAGIAAVAALPAWPLLGGVALGFLLCCGAGRAVSARPMFENFLRFHIPISPTSLFYPTASELVSQVRNTVPTDKCLVLVGGASYFRGAGQNPKDLWTLELQRLLGDDYAVVNFAMDQAGITSFAGVAFQVLARDYPRIAYVTNASPVVVDAVDGGEIYRYVFWDAYYKGMLDLPTPWSDRVRELAKTERKDRAGLELHLGKWTDHFTYACDLWTYVGYKHFFTVWSDFFPQTTTTARREYVDPVNTALAQKQQAFRDNPAYTKRYEDSNKDYATKGFIKDETGRWKIEPSAFDIISQLSVSMFPDDLRPKCYLVLVRTNPYFMKTFTEDDWSRHQTMYRLGQEAFEHAGYRVVQLPDADFTPDDYFDAGHYMVSGGRKLAKAVAERIQETGKERAAPGQGAR
jgi:hypothetical protein